MRIGIDMFGVQSPSRHRGIGRYTRHLVRTLLTQHAEHEYFLYFYDGLEGAGDGWPGRPIIRRLTHDFPRRTLRHSPQQLTKLGDRLDALLLTCAVESFEGYLPPGSLPEGPPTAAILYDLIPAMMPDEYLNQPGLAEAYHAALRRLRQYDRLLAISEATRRDGLRQLGLAEGRIVTIGTAVDGGFFVPDRRQPVPEDVSRMLTGLGIVRPFVFCLSGTDERKNLRGLLAAYDCLPERLRRSHQLVITCRMNEAEAAHWRAEVRRRGGDGQVLFTDFLPDDIVRTLYQRCAAFVFPSLYEGFGLPLLEAMHCGAAVLAGDNSSQPEVVGDAGLLVDAGNAPALADRLAQLLENPGLARTLGERALVQARKFSWEATARRTAAALESLAPSTGHELHRGSAARKQRIAYFSPLPPKRSGISDYSQRLLAALKEHYTIDLFHDVGYTPHLAHASHEFACHDYRLFPRCQRALNYAGIVYQMGNSEHHSFVYETLLKHPGVVVLHDFVLSDFHYWYSLQPGTPPDFFEREIAYDAPRLPADDRLPAKWVDEPGGVVAACNRRGIAFNRRILEHAAQIVVHEAWGAERIGALYPELASRLHVVPHGASIYPHTDEQRQAVRRRYGFAASDLVLGCFGILHESKYPVETVAAFAALAEEFAAARLIFVGRDFGGGAAQAKAAELGVADRVRFFGHASMDAFLELISITDLGVNLRRPPTHGETSGALLTLLGSGVPTIVTDVDTFGGYPDSAVCKIPPLEAADRSLEQAIRRLAEQPELRRQIGLAASRHIGENHPWPRIAALYAEAIERARSTSRAA